MGRFAQSGCSGVVVNWVDLLLTTSVVLAVFNGWRVGIIRGVTGFLGLIAGALLALQIIPIAINAFQLGIGWRVFGGVAFIVTLAMVGQSIGFALGSTIRSILSWSPIRFIDSLFGAAFRVVSWAVVVWLAASVLALLPENSLTSQVRSSQIVQQIDGVAPTYADSATAALRKVLRNTSFPQVFAGIAPQPTHSVEPADAGIVGDPDVVARLDSIVEVLAEAPSCEMQMSGTGFLYDDGRIMTNAHVVAGADQVVVRRDGDTRQYRARVVLFDPRLDIAVLAINGFDGVPLSFAPEAGVGVQAVIPGFTGGRALSPDAARISEVIVARGHDIYGEGRVDREIYVLRANVAPGDSGAPLLDLDGRVLGVMFAAGTDLKEAGYALTANAVASAATQGAMATKAVSLGKCSA